MELLVILLGEFLFFPFIGAIVFIVNFLLFLPGLILDFWVFYPTWKEHRHQGTRSVRKAYKRKIFFPFRFILKISTYLLLLLFFINLFFFEPSLRFIAGQIEKKNGIEVSFSSAEGDLFSGRATFHELKIKRHNQPKTDFDLSARHVVLDIDMFSIASSPIKIETLHVEGIEGDVRSKDAPPAMAPAPPPSQGPSPTSPAPEKLKAKKPFVIQDLALKGIKLRLHKGTHEPLLLSLSSMDSKPLRSQYAIFDTFFRSNISGDLDGHEIMITSREAGQGRETHWRLDDFPVKVIGQFIDKAPLNWFKDGTLDVTVEDQWAYGDHAEIAMDWSLIFNAVKLEAPENTSLTQRALAAPFVHYINGKDGPLDLSFTLVMNEDQFDGSASLDAAGLWDILVDTMSKKLAQMSGQKKDAIKEGVKDTVDSFKSFLNKKRTGQSEVDEIKAPE